MGMYVNPHPSRCTSNSIQGYYPIGIIALTLTILLAVYHDQIVDFLRPAADWMHEYVQHTS